MPVPPQAQVTVRSPAKINLGLSVGPPRPDGFHPLATVYQAVALYDDVTATLRDDDGVTVEVVGDFADDVPADDSNLAVRAARLLQAEYDVEEGVDLVIRKTIPVAGGMAGGSTDAAATLVACNRLWGLGLSQAELEHVGAELGSDVPFCLVGHTALGRGRGEQVTEVMSRGTFHWVFAIAEGGLSTPAVFQELDRLRPLRRVEQPEVQPELLSALLSGEPTALAIALSNDMQVAALSLRPELADTLQFGLDQGALAAMISGSGPTCLFLAADSRRAVDLAVELAESGLCRMVRQAEGPVPGARIHPAPINR
ncbi:4-(cytidine 5'-diphospho)-2-C-methyl-D-erythritol kinase [Kribbella sp. VKM Ac-2568]|uniref:4-(cytidine 5'-diphospho)-2-C-methyl-D-erythritol kinase n=1 Tax=Kribbella sp. VKM Ac-2568 TaxID=2512219 RepID=UPI001047DF80|nr:4-(cytidine 5'-diphospho)-2-C-methyl-D-erythritol kinase [Kribbella sp. VKM Ac-2568]TCM47690.1 4-diphosphocytidyl-2-C-methyl-D-erythritol kinase [Kribbella sp. VKM Ac-2568]